MKPWLSSCLGLILLSGCAVKREYNANWYTSRGNFERTAAVADAPAAPLQQKWVFETGGRIAYAPSVYDGVIYFGSRDSRLYALRLEDGSELWKEELEQGGIYQSPTVTADTIFTGKWAPYYFVYAWQRATGEMLWSRQTGDLVNRAPWIISDAERLYTQVDPPYPSDPEIKTMATAWNLSDQTTVWNTPLTGIPEQVPSLSEELLLIATDDKQLQALERQTGVIRWSQSLASKPVSAPLLTGDKVIVATESGFVYAFKIQDGKIDWRYQFVGARLSGDMALKGHLLYLPGEQYLYSFDLNNLEAGWKFRAPKNITAPVVSDNNVYFGCANNMLYVMDRKKGYVTGLYRIGGEIMAPPTLAGGLLLVGASDGKLYAFEEKPIQEQQKTTGPTRTLNQRW